MNSFTKAKNGNLTKIISQMTIEEKVAQLGSIKPDQLLENGEFSEDRAREYLQNGIGQITRLGGGSGLPPQRVAELSNIIQDFLEKETELGIPAIIHEECLSGYMGDGGTIYPQAIGLASTWHPELVEKITTTIKKQLTSIGVQQALSPVLDVARDLRWGRVEETFGEDPYLVATIGKSYIDGLQGSGPKEGITATVKHFGGHSVSEGGRNHCPVNLSERELRENFLFPFEAVIREAGVKSVMNAYNDIDGIPCASSKKLLTNILREDMGFNGVTVSDYGSIEMLHTDHFVANNKQEAGIMALNAGLDVELPSTKCYGDRLVKAVEEGLIAEETLNRSVERHLELKHRKGLFEGKNTVDVEEANKHFETPKQRNLVRRVGRESLVLLKNQGDILPLSNEQEAIAVIGPSADNAQNLLGDYAYGAIEENDRDTTTVTTILDGIKYKIAGNPSIRYAEGCKTKERTREGFNTAVEAANRSDFAILAVGGRSGRAGPETQPEDHFYTAGEGNDRTDLRLPGVQLELLKKIHETGTPIIALLINGRPLSVPWLQEHVPAIVECWLPGEEGGKAVADVLFGSHDPGGKLPVSIPKKVGQSPVYYRRKPISKERRYVFTNNEPLYPFGFGLSYADFEYSELEIAPKEVKIQSKLKVSCRVKNTGDVPGKEVVQLYIRDEYASVTRPERELKGFEKVKLAPGEEKKVSFCLPTDLLSFYDENMNLIVEPGTFEVMIGSSSQDIRLAGELEVLGENKEIGPDREYFSETNVSMAHNSENVKNA